MKIVSAAFVFAGLGGVLLWLWIRAWYGRLVRATRADVRHPDGRTVPGDPPRTLFGNLPAVYRAPNRLAAYNGFHTRFGEIVQLYWMWRPQVSVAGYSMALRVLLANQLNYRKHPPNWVLQRLFGSSVLSENGEAWKRFRMLVNDIFSARRIPAFHDLFVANAERLAFKWERCLPQLDGTPVNILPDLTAVSLDIIATDAMGRDVGAFEGGTSEFLEAFNYIIDQSTRPVHAFAHWRRHLPLPRLNRAFQTVDRFMEDLIRERRKAATSGQPRAGNLIDALLAATRPSGDMVPLTDREVQDNLFAILINGHQTVAICLALTLYLLARHPEKLVKARAEVDALGRDAAPELHYLESVIMESLRIYPAVAGLQRRSIGADVLDGWSIPPRRAVGITLMPLHADPAYFGDAPEEFRPERYAVSASAGDCLVHKTARKSLPVGAKIAGGTCLPLTFGAGARRCLGEHFAIHEMKVVLATLISRFDFTAAPGFEPDLDLDRFNLFIALRSNNGVRVGVARRTGMTNV